jgi:hypothetical protein
MLETCARVYVYVPVQPKVDYKCQRFLSLPVTIFCVDGTTAPRYRARLEPWIVANLCKRNVDDVLR